MTHYYFGFSFDDLVDNIALKSNYSLILTHPQDNNKIIIFYEYDQETNGIIYYENEENWDYQLLPKEETNRFYLDCRKNDYIPLKI